MSLLAIQAQCWEWSEGSLGPLPNHSVAAESLWPGEAGKEERRGIGKCRQEVPAGKKRRRVGLLGDFNGLIWMLLIAVTPMYRKMP